MLSDVREQEEGVRLLRRVIDRHYTSPLLLVGDEGVGRRFSVVQATKEMFCTGTHENNCACFDCYQIDKGVHPDFLVVEPEVGKDIISIEAIRGLITEVGVCPTMAGCRVVMIDGADLLTTQAANALLKTLEEPPRSVQFLLLAESKVRVIPTIRSRCGFVPYRSLSEPMVLSVLHRFAPDDAKALVYARLSEGSVGRAVRYWGAGRLVLRDKTFSLLRLAVEKDVAGLFSVITSVEKDLPQVLRFLGHLLHDLLVVPVDPTRIFNLDMSTDIAQMSPRASAAKWLRLATAVQELHERSMATTLMLSFHLKALFAQAFVGS